MSEKKKKDRHLLHTGIRLFGMMWKYRLMLIFACLCMVVSSVTAVRGTYYLKPLVNDHIVPLIGEALEHADLKSAILAAMGRGSSSLAEVARLLLMMFCFYLVSMATSLGESQIMVFLGTHVLADLRGKLFDSLVGQPLLTVSSQTSGSLMSCFTNDMDALSNMLRKSIPYLVNGITTCFSILVTMFMVNVPLTLIVLVCVGFMVPVMNYLARKSMKHTAAQQACLMELNSKGKEYVEGQELIRVLQMEETAGKDFSEKNGELFEHAFRASFYTSGIFSLTNGISQIGYALILFMGALLASRQLADVGTVALFAQYYTSFYKPLADMTKQLSSVLSALAGAERIFRVMDREPEADEGTISLVNCERDTNGTLRETEKRDASFAWKTPEGLRTLKGELTLKDVVFGYVPGTKILNGISLTIHPGETVALLGSTGAGKTTVISLLNRLYEIQGGEIDFDGIDITRIQKESLRRALATVSQDTHLFTDTIAGNLRFSRPEAGEEELRAALTLTGADFFVEHQPEKMDTVLERAGEKLSQGERQLLTIARAAVSDAPVLILDEATSSVDTYTEQKIHQAFDRLMKNKTVLVIAHRLSTVQDADRIVILDQGGIMESGTPKELTRRKGYYYRLLHAQEELS